VDPQFAAQALDSLMHSFDQQTVGSQRAVVVADGIGDLEPPEAGDREVEHRRFRALSG